MSTDPGATRMWMIIHDRDPQPGDRVLVAEGVTLTDEDGHSFWSQTGELRESTVVDDTPPTTPGS